MNAKKYRLLFKVTPAGYFGLPQEGTIVVPGKPGRQMYGPTLDSRSGNFVSYGTLPEYRRDDEGLNLALDLGQSRLTVRDNFFTLEVEAIDRQAALRGGSTLFERFLRLLSVEQGDLFECELLQVESDDGELEVRPGPKMVQLVRATIYSLDGLEKNVRAAVTRCSTEDERLTKALLYYEHAGFLFRMREHAGFFSPHFSFLLTSAYLNLWKAITLILGEPGTDLDYQSRFRSFGLPKNYWRDEVQPLAEVRNAFDVAHYSMDSAAIERVETSFGKAEQLCRTVLRAYADYLVNPTSAAGGE